MSNKLKEYRKYVIPFLLGVFLFALITNYEGALMFLSGMFDAIWFVLSRILVGFAMAYILNLTVRSLKRRLKFPTWLGIVTAYIVLIGVIVWLIAYIIPYIQESVERIVSFAPNVTTGIRDFLEHNFRGFDEQGLTFVSDFINGLSGSLSSWFSSLFNASTIIPLVGGVARTLTNITFWFMISIYALIDKDRVLRALQRIMLAFMKPGKAEKRIQFCKDANRIFSSYIVGKFIDSFIIGVLSLILYGIFGIEMWPFLAVVAFAFNMIPYFGPIISGAAAAIIQLIFGTPLQALYCLIICVALQTLDGYVIGPKILGDAVGISPLLTIVAIAIGGDVAGLLGILLSVPVLAVAKILVIDPAVKARLQRRKAEQTKPPPSDSTPHPD